MDKKQNVEPWTNPIPLKRPAGVSCRTPDVADLPLDQFPIVDDFEVDIYQTNFSEFGFHVKFRSESLGYLASFPWWDHAEREIRRPEFVIPCGTVQDPFYDLEQGWELSIFEVDAFVYLIEGDFDSSEDYYLWFKVPTELYFRSWKKSIAECIASAI